mmetsp:Transcript_38675/g.64150  ORF Transcript_38675/g.64150 Transcript_38675/m.64150 type:complete len:404 (-) Transcript_38675:300-1511(-)
MALSRIGIREGARLDDVLINANQCAGVATSYSLHCLGLSAHHEDRALNALDIHILLLANHVVGTHDLHLRAGPHSAGEDTAKSKKAALVRGWDHLGHIHHHRSLRVTFCNTRKPSIVGGARVQYLGAITLRLTRRREMLDEHLKQRVVCRQPFLHAALQQRLLLQLQVFFVQRDPDSGKHLSQASSVVSHGRVEDLVNRVEAKHAESNRTVRSRAACRLDPFLLFGNKVVVTPQARHHLLKIDAKFFCVHARKLCESERPTMKASRESNSAFGGVDLALAKLFVVIGSTQHVDVFNVLHEACVHFIGFKLQLKKATVKLVHSDNRLDTLSQSLSQHGLSLYAHAFNTIDDHECSIGNAKRGSYFGRKIDVARRIDEVDQEVWSIRIWRKGIVGLCLEEKRDTR